MKKQLFTMSLILFSLCAIAQGPVAVDDSTTLRLGEFVTVNVTQNDYHPDGLTFKVLDAYKAYSFTDSTITYYAEYNKYYNVDVDFVFDYSLIDENGQITEESFANVYIDFVNTDFSGFLDVNNIRARINSWGNHFWRGVDELSVYPDVDTTLFEYENGSHKNTIFNKALWVGGMDENGQLRLSAERYRQLGMDFWTGPLSVEGADVSISESTAIAWNKVWKLNVDEILFHKLNWSTPGYEPIDAIATWPAHGDPDLYQNEYLAPFIDVDEDSYYNPMKGDYPLIRGDQCIFFITNDVRSHTESGGKQIGIEIHGMAYEFFKPENDPMHSSVFLSYKIFNRSNLTLSDTYIGLFCDFDIGYAMDDYVGCDVARGAFYGYNGEEIDGGNADVSYGENPPAQGIVILGGPYMDANGKDDPDGECDESINGVGFGDGIEDNERYGMKKFLYFKNTLGPQGDPQDAEEYYNYMKGIWRDGTAMEYGGNGHVASGAYGPAANFMFPGLSDECFWGTGGEEPYGPIDWTEESANNESGDRRGLSVMGPFTFLPNSMQKVDLAFVTARGDNGPYSSVKLLKEYIDEVKEEYYQDTDYFGYQWLEVDEKVIIEKNALKVFPNPATTEIWVDHNSGSSEITLTIHDIYGRKIMQETIHPDKSVKVSIEDFKKGLYIVSLQDGNMLYTAKVMKK